MKKRMARRGKNRGNFFYGCSRYPRCKGTLDLENDNNSLIDKGVAGGGDLGVESYDGATSRREIKVPVFLQAREKFQNYQVRFYETLAMPHDYLDRISFGEINKSEVEFFGRFRIDYPITSNSPAPDLKQLFIVAYKILSRGRITLISPDIEKDLKKYFKADELTQENCDFHKYLILPAPQNKSDIWFDGEGTEKEFYEKVLPEIFGPHYRKYALPQVHFSSLAPTAGNTDTSDYQRVDFFIHTKTKNIVVELDGAEHESHKLRDQSRDELLTKAGYEVIRIKNDEVNNRIGQNIQQLYNIFENEDVNKEPSKPTKEEKYLIAVKLVHQLQIAIIEAYLSGNIDINEKGVIYFDYKSAIFNKSEAQQIVKAVEGDLKKLMDNLGSLYQRNIQVDNLSVSLFGSGLDQENSIVISYNENLSINIPKFIIQDISFNSAIAHYARPTQVEQIENPKTEILEYFLEYIFRYKKFLEGQLEAITRALTGQDAIVLLPTGSGKSLAFQLASMLLPGVTIVIDPILALINDQIDNLERIGIDRAIGITSQISDPGLKSKVISAFGQGEYIFCYVAPERFQTEEFRNTIKDLTVSTPISLIVIDEAHCVSEWGHDFRTSYLNVGRITRDYCRSDNRIPPLLALTGTASNSVLRDVQRELQINDFEAIITPKTFDRKELRYSVFECSSEKKFNVLKGYLQRKLPEKFGLSNSSFYQPRGKDTKCGLIFCPHVGGSFGSVENATKVTNELGIQAKYYGGKSPKGWRDEEWSNYKIKTEKEFKNNQFCLLIATKAFGMGIDKPNIRYTVHFGIPNSVESFYQEAGRAGRDRHPAECAVLISNDNHDRTSRLLNPENTIENIAIIMDEERDWDSDDDITRAIWFHANAFQGVKSELNDVNQILNSVDDLSKKVKINFVIDKKQRKSVEKGVHRLLILGVVSDYTIDYSNNEFHVQFSGIDKNEIIDRYAKYVNGYNKGRVETEAKKLRVHKNEDLRNFIESASEILISFIYDTIEKGRRRALREMLTMAEAPFQEENRGKDADKLVRDRILRYLESTYSEEIEEILNGKEGGFEELKKLIGGHETEEGEIIGGLRSPKDAAEVRGQTARYLESTPDHPGLLFLRSLSEIYSKSSDEQVIIQNLNAGMDFSLNRYSIAKEKLYSMVSWIISRIYERNRKMCRIVTKGLIYDVNDYDLAKFILNSEIGDDLLDIPGTFIFHKLSKDAIEIFK